MTRRRARLLQLLGLLIAVGGLVGFWLNRDVPRAPVTAAVAEVINPTGEAFQASFVLAGRDYEYAQQAGPIVGRGGQRSRPAQGRRLGNRTDTIIYVNITGNRVTMVNVPRDIYLDAYQTKVNTMYYYRGADGLKQSVSDLLGVPIDYYAVIDLDIFEGLVDAVDGVDVNVPLPMFHDDYAAGLFIALEPGPQRLTGEQAAGFARYRNLPNGDLDRIENIKTLAHALLARIKALNVRAVGSIPKLIETFYADVETNIGLPMLLQLAPRLAELDIRAATLPTYFIEGSSNLGIRQSEVEGTLADIFGGRAREISEMPETTILITNRSGAPGLADVYRERLTRIGVPEAQLVTREGDTTDPTPTRLLTLPRHWQDGLYFADLMHVGQQQVRVINAPTGVRAQLELVLGEDAIRFAPQQPGQLSHQTPSQTLSQTFNQGGQD